MLLKLLRGKLRVAYWFSISAYVLIKEVCWNTMIELLSQYVYSSSVRKFWGQIAASRSEKCVLITYSQADLGIFLDRQLFPDGVCEAVLNCEGPKSKVTRWTCSQENHKKQGKHYHMVIKLNKIKRWLLMWQYLKNKWSVYIHFSNWHTNYYSAWMYITKEDEYCIQSAGHPDLGNSGSPRIMAAS